MFHSKTLHRPDAQSVPHDDAVMRTAPLRCLFHERGEAFMNAAALLGGSRAVTQCRGAIEALAQGGGLTRSLERALRALHDVLTLRHVHDDSRIEAELFAAIDPVDPVVEEICLLADQLGNAMRESGFKPLQH